MRCSTYLTRVLRNSLPTNLQKETNIKTSYKKHLKTTRFAQAFLRVSLVTMGVSGAQEITHLYLYTG